MVDEAHIPHRKHYQLGVEFDEEGNPVGDNRKIIPENQRDEVWADATTVEQFKEDIELLARESGGT